MFKLKITLMSRLCTREKYTKNHDTFNSTHKFIFSKLSFNKLSYRNDFKIINFNQGKNKRGYYYLGVYIAK